VPQAIFIVYFKADVLVREIAMHSVGLLAENAKWQYFLFCLNWLGAETEVWSCLWDTASSGEGI